MAGGFRFLSLVRPFMSVLPEVAAAERKIPFRCASVGEARDETRRQRAQRVPLTSILNSSYLGTTIHGQPQWPPPPG